MKTARPTIPTPPECIPSTLESFRLFIFDLDGTLYNQPALRRILMLHLVVKLVFFRIRIIDLRIIKTFRNVREQHKGFSSDVLDEIQYQWCAGRLKLPVGYVKEVIEKYMLRFPLQFMPELRFEGVKELFGKLHERKKPVVIFSDYPAIDKIKALGLMAEGYYCSTDREIGQLKPSAKALQHICKTMNCSISEAILIGDRDDTDGESARQAGMDYLIIDTAKARRGDYFMHLSKIV